MDIDALLQSINKYARDYITFLIGFFDHRHSEAKTEHIGDKDGRIIIHGLLSLTLGIYLTQIFVSETAPNQDDMLVAMIRQFGDWLFFALLIFLMARVLMIHTTFTDAFSAVLRVFPPAYIIGAIAMLLAVDAVYAFGDARLTAEATKCRGWYGLIGGATVSWLLTIYGLGFALRQPTAHSAPVVPFRRRRLMIVVLISGIFFVTSVITLKPELMVKEMSKYCRRSPEAKMPLPPPGAFKKG